MKMYSACPANLYSVIDTHNIIYLDNELRVRGYPTPYVCNENFNAFQYNRLNYYAAGDSNSKIRNSSHALRNVPFDLSERNGQPCSVLDRADVKENCLLLSDLEVPKNMDELSREINFELEKEKDVRSNDDAGLIGANCEMEDKIEDAEVGREEIISVGLDADGTTNYDVIHTISESFETSSSLEDSKVIPVGGSLEYSPTTGAKSARSDCGRKFANESSLQLHTRRVRSSDDRPHKCQYCALTFNQRSNLKSHERRHTGEKPFPCSVCGARFTQGTALKTHFRRRHSVTKRIIKTDSKKYFIKNFFCEACSKTYVGVHKKEHMKTHNLKSEYICNICFKYCRTKETLVKHVSIHAPAYCGIELKNTGVKDNSGNQEKSLRSSGHKERAMDLECSFCGKSFKYKHNLKIHRRTHTNERPYKCETCGVSFRQISHLKEHVWKHTKKRRFWCPVCEKRFSRRYNAVKHIRSKHPLSTDFLVNVDNFSVSGASDS